jgi:hypothetical protein
MLQAVTSENVKLNLRKRRQTAWTVVGWTCIVFRQEGRLTKKEKQKQEKRRTSDLKNKQSLRSGWETVKENSKSEYVQVGDNAMNTTDAHFLQNSYWTN